MTVTSRISQWWIPYSRSCRPSPLPRSAEERKSISRRFPVIPIKAMGCPDFLSATMRCSTSCSADGTYVWIFSISASDRNRCVVRTESFQTLTSYAAAPVLFFASHIHSFSRGPALSLYGIKQSCWQMLWYMQRTLFKDEAGSYICETVLNVSAFYDFFG